MLGHVDQCFTAAVVVAFDQRQALVGTTEQAEQTEQSVPAAPADGAGAPQDAATDSRGSAAE